MSSLWPSFPPFKPSLELPERTQTLPLELPYPTVRDRVDRHRIDEMELLAALALRRQQVGRLENGEMLRHRLAAHVGSLAQLAQRLAVLASEAVQQLATARIRQRAEDSIVVIHPPNMQPDGCLSRGPANSIALLRTRPS